jgi:OOP family OmpA-OmpF porin
MLAAGVASYFAARRIPRPYSLENLFLIHNDGRLISHVTKHENTNMDKDVVSAMFTAVQEFVRDSFQQGEVGLKKLEIGDKNVFIEKGNSVYLALIYSGWPPKETFSSLTMLLRDIEERYDERIERWNGTMKAVVGVESMLQNFMSSRFRPGSWHVEEDIGEEEWVDILSEDV